MNRFELLSDLRDLVRLCFEDNCQYLTVITRGNPTPECNLIGFWVGDEILDRFGDCRGADCDVTENFPIFVKLTRICMGPLAGVNVNWVAEEAEAQCFYSDVERLECCLDSSATFAQLEADHYVSSIARQSTRFEQRPQGGAFSAILTLNVEAEQCCDDVS